MLQGMFQAQLWLPAAPEAKRPKVEAGKTGRTGKKTQQKHVGRFTTPALAAQCVSSTPLLQAALHAWNASHDILSCRAYDLAAAKYGVFKEYQREAKLNFPHFRAEQHPLYQVSPKSALAGKLSRLL